MTRISGRVLWFCCHISLNSHARTIKLINPIDNDFNEMLDDYISIHEGDLCFRFLSVLAFDKSKVNSLADSALFIGSFARETIIQENMSMRTGSTLNLRGLRKPKSVVLIFLWTLLGTLRVARFLDFLIGMYIHFDWEEYLHGCLENIMALTHKFIDLMTGITWHGINWSLSRRRRFDQKSPVMYQWYPKQCVIH